jgi:hypothetical protein
LFCLGLQLISIRVANTHPAVSAAKWLTENGIMLIGVGVLYVLLGVIPNAGTPRKPEAPGSGRPRMKELDVFELATKLG